MFDDLRESYYFNHGQLKSQEFSLGHKIVRTGLEGNSAIKNPCAFVEDLGSVPVDLTPSTDLFKHCNVYGKVTYIQANIHTHEIS